MVTMKIAVTGCLHGELDKIYQTIADMEARSGTKVELVLCCGDLQAIRNPGDLVAVSIPEKYRFLGDFPKYYSGQAKAPVLTIVVGGNHEASNYLQELPYGGWLAPNIYFMGYSGVVNFGGLRIAGLSGIYKQHDYTLGHFEHAPYNESSKRSAYHVRNVDVFRLSQIVLPLDVILSHDWPRGIYHYGNQAELLMNKPFFRSEIEENTLGSKPGEDLLALLKPRYWFAAHMHVKFAAVVAHDVEGEKVTRFLALDKCLPGRDFIQFLDIEPRTKEQSEEGVLQLDPEWLCVLAGTDHLFSLSRAPCMMPGPHTHERWDFSASPEAIEEMVERFGGELALPDNFEPTAAAYKPKPGKEAPDPKPTVHSNPQTELLCAMLDIKNPNADFLGKSCSITELQQRLEKASSSEEENYSDSSSSDDEESDEEGGDDTKEENEDSEDDDDDDDDEDDDDEEEEEEEAVEGGVQETSELPSSFQRSSFEGNSAITESTYLSDPASPE